MLAKACHELCDIIDICPVLIFTELLKMACIIITYFNNIFSYTFGQPSKVLNHDGIRLGDAFTAIEFIKDSNDATGESTNKNTNSVTPAPLKER
jgi:hypothetical protein